VSEKVKPVPDGYHSLTPYLIVNDAARAIEFYEEAFGATEIMRLDAPDGKVGHAELKIGDSIIMLSDECEETGQRNPQALGGTPVGLMLYVEDVDTVVGRAVSAGAKLVRPVKDQFYGDRTGGVEDPFGHSWYVATHVEDVTPEELQRRVASMYEVSA
jgi:PhnB protein